MIELNFTDWNFVLTVITALGVIVAVVSLIFQTRGEKKAEELTAFAEYTKRYQEIMLHLPENLNDSTAKLTPTENRYLWTYFDLCSEEYFLYQNGYINETVWQEWRSGIKAAFEKPLFVSAWESKDTASYSEFKKLVVELRNEIENEKNKE